MSCPRCGAGEHRPPQSPNARPGGADSVPRPSQPNQGAVNDAIRNAISGLKYVPNSIGPNGCRR